MNRLEAGLLIGAAMVNLGTFAVFGFHSRIELGWGIGIGSFEVLSYTGLALTTAWVPWHLTDDPREARILMLSIFIVFFSLVVLSS